MNLRVLPGGARRPPSRNYSEFPDEALLALAAREDEEALAQLYDRYSRVAYGLALRIVRDQALAEDAVQEAFLTVWRTAGSFRSDRAKPSTWILTLVHRRAVDVVRREERRRAAPLDSVEAQEETGLATDEEVQLADRRRLVQQALRQLPDEQREALELAYYAGLTQSELAERLSVPLGTISQHPVLELDGDLLLRDTGKIECVHVRVVGLPDVESRDPAPLARAVPLTEHPEHPAHLVLERGHLAERIESNQRCHLLPPSFLL